MKSQKKKDMTSVPPVKTLAEEVADEVLDEIMAEGDAPFEVADSSQGKKLIFHIHNTAFLFLLLPLVQSLLDSYKEALDEIYSDKIAVRRGKSRMPLSNFKPEVNDEGAKIYARMGVRMFLLGIRNKLDMSLWELAEEVAIMHHASIQAIAARQLAQQALDLEGCDYYMTELKKHLRLMAEERRSYLLDSHERFLDKADMSKLDEWYQKLLPLWSQAKQLYKQRDKFPEWQKLAVAAFEEIRPPNDLMKRVSGVYTDLPTWLYAKVDKQGTDARPSHLALEHAARKCGALPYRYSRSQLHNLLRDAKSKVQEAEGTH